MNARRSHMVSPWPVRADRSPRAGQAVDDAVPLLLELHRALDGAPPPCSADPVAWTSSEPEDVKVAVAGCRPCPAMTQCRAYATAVRPRIGVWAGRAVVVRRSRYDDDNDIDTDTTESSSA